MPHTKLTKQAKDLIFYHNFLLRGGKRYIEETQTAIALMPSDPPPLLKNLMDIFVRSQVLSGNWALMDCFQFYAMDTAANAVINWIGNFSNGLLVNSPVHTPFNNILGDGVDQEINTGYNPTVDSITGVGIDNIQAGVWVVDNLDATSLSRLLDTADQAFRIFQQTDIKLKVNNFSVTSHVGANFSDGILYSGKRVDSANEILITDASESSKVRDSSTFTNSDMVVFGLGDWLNAKVGTFYACNPTGFNTTNFHANLKIFVDDTALLG